MSFNTTKPALLWCDSDTFQVGQVLRYTAKNGDLIQIPFIYRKNNYTGEENGLIISMLTDLGSKPLFSAAIVGDRCDEYSLSYIMHDWLFVSKGVIRDGTFVNIPFSRTQELLDEMMQTVVGGSDFKRKTILTAVGLGGKDYYNSRKPCDLNSITEKNLTEDFAVLTVRITPSFEV